MAADFRSDTVTLIDAEMREAMVSAEVGDDFYGEDPTVARLEAEVAETVGQQAGVFVPNGTLANVLAIGTLCDRDQVLSHEHSDIVAWESHTIARLCGVVCRGLPGALGRLDDYALTSALAATDPAAPRPGMVAFENTHSASGGSFWSLAEVADLAERCARSDVPLYCDGARLFNASVAGGYQPADVGSLCAAVSVSLYKGLGAPMGAVFASDGRTAGRARHLRRTLGCTFRQIGHLAATGLVGLRRWSELKRDHELAMDLWKGLRDRMPDAVVGAAPASNMVVLDLDAASADFIGALASHGVRVTEIVPGRIRFVTHRDLDGEDVIRALKAVEAYSGSVPS